MSEQKPLPRGRTFLAGKVISNYGQSTIDCTVRRISDTGAVIEVETVLGIPEHFHLLIPGEGDPLPCKRSWQSEKQIGLVFDVEDVKAEAAEAGLDGSKGADQIMRSQTLALRAALDVMDVGVVLLDADMKSQFINRAFRRMWALPDATADRNPSFVALLYHGRDTKAYEIEPAAIDRHIANRVRTVREGDATPIDVRLTNGAVVRVQCASLPNGGRIVTYSYVTDIVRHMDELEVLRSALDNVSEGIIMLDSNLNAQFLNGKIRQYWALTEAEADSRPSFESLLRRAPHAGARMPPDELDAFCTARLAAIRDVSEPVRVLQTADGRHIRAHCTALKNGGRMLTFVGITDLVNNARKLEELATTDSMTGLANRRHFMALAAAEWSRFQRYYRPLSVLMIDVDHFKSVNDRYGHAVGDDALVAVANACLESKRSSDIVGRIGGEEFAMLLPETDLYQARIVADRICKAVAASKLQADEVPFKVTASIGFAAATVSMPGFEALLKAADQALYQAKDQGRNRIVGWSPPPATKLAAE
ncbi:MULTISPECIES: sensor domain-containing diguanylate cyclase [unclassified Bradyrhizobium]|uniref:sensor domain-containing diguanylate cyclase n=1 Tax=unclassified Bradyrhizobium TaxID=2631580 RepID=UPI002010F083|nr:MULTISPECIES: sensor domain-containing diguanylate cyclase [unclassified Bradyrhizobium]